MRRGSMKTTVMFGVKIVLVLILTSFTEKTDATPPDVFINETLLKCIPEDIQGLKEYKISVHEYHYKGYFLPVVTDLYKFNITEIASKEPNDRFELSYYSDIDGQNVGTIDKTQNDHDLLTTTWSSVPLVSGRLYLLTFIRKLSLKEHSMTFRCVNHSLNSASPWKEMKNHTIRFTESSSNKSRSLLGEWGAWSSCSESCGNGTKVRQRLCSNDTLNLVGKMDVPTTSSEATTCQQNVSCTGVAYFIGPKGTTCHDKCNQEGRICAKYGHDFPPTDAKGVFEALGITCTSTKDERAEVSALLQYSDDSQVVCMRFKMIEEKLFSCEKTHQNRICPCAPKPVPPIIGKIMHFDHPRRLDIPLSKPQTPRWQYYESFTATAFDLNGTLVVRSKTIKKNEYWVVHNNLQPLTNYCIKAYTTSSNGDGDYTASCVYSDTRDVPSQAPTNLSAHLVNATQISASWNPINMSYPVMYGMPFKYYRVYAVQYGTNKQQLQKTSQTSAMISNLLYYTTYCIKVAAYSTLGRGKLTDGCLVNVTTMGGVPKSFPSPVSILNVSGDSIDVSWERPSLDKLGDNETEFKLYINHSLAILNASNAFNTSITSNTNWSFINLQPMTSYVIMISAVNQHGEGPRSDWYNVTTRENAPLSYPAVFQITSVTSWSAILNWSSIPPDSNHAGPVSGYFIYRIKCISVGVESSELIQVDGASTLKYKDSSLSLFTCYRFSIAGFNEGGTGPKSNWITATTLEEVPSWYPLKLTSQELSKTAVNMSWGDVPEQSQHGIILGYTLCIWNEKTLLCDEHLWFCNKTHYDVISMTSGVSYCFKVAAFTSVGLGPRSPCVNVTTRTAPTAPPSNVTAYNTSSTSIRIEWNAVPERHRHGTIIEYLVTITQSNINYTYKSINQSLDVHNLTAYTVYNITVQAINGEGPGMSSPSIMVWTDEGVPSLALSSFKVVGKGATAIKFSWTGIPDSKINGVLKGYKFYVRKCGSSNESVRTYNTSSQISGISIVDLRPMTCYNVSAAQFTGKGPGKRSEWDNGNTTESVPSESPENIAAYNTSSTSINITWGQVPEDDRNGIVIGFKVVLVNGESNITISTTVVDVLTKHLEVTNLEYYTLYCVRVLAFTRVGNGTLSPCVMVFTEEDVPSTPPMSITLNTSSTTSIAVTWQPVPVEHRNGIVTEYNIQHQICDNLNSTTDVSAPQDATMLSVPVRPYTCYKLRVCAVTKIGPGVYSDWFSITTPQDRPGNVPQNIATEANSSTSIAVTWNDVPPVDQNGIIMGYQVQYTDDSNTVVIVNTTAKGYYLKNLQKFTVYCVQVLAFTIVGEGNWSSCVNQRTNADLPEGPMSQPTGQNLSTTAITLSWQKPDNKTLNGLLRGFAISIYRYWYSGGMVTTPVRTVLTCADSTSKVIDNLYEGVKFCLVISAFTDVGQGQPSNCSHITTNEDVPSAPPRDIEVFATSSTSLLVSWRIIDWSERNGVLQGFTLVVRPTGIATTAPATTPPTTDEPATTPATTDEPATTLPIAAVPIVISPRRKRRDLDFLPLETANTRKRRHRRSVNPTDIVINIVDPGMQSYEVKNLEKGVEYCIIMYGRTAVGDGVKSNCQNRKTPLKDEIIPTVKAQASATSINVSLNITDFENLRSTGYLQYYDLQFTVLRVNGNPVLDKDVIKRTFNASTQHFTLDNFNIYTTYSLQLSLVTRRGSGSLTDPVYVETCRCPSTFYTNWFLSPPFTNLNSGSQPGGILPIILEYIIDAACGRCEFSHETSSVEFFNDVKGKRTNFKANKTLALGDINRKIDITFPINSKNEGKYKGTYVPILNVPALLLIKRNESSLDKYAKVVAGSILDIWPVIVINIALMFLAGAIIWTIERASNSDQFPTKTAKGLFEGTWWSFITMTTIGYGDRYPVTVPGRIFAIIWALVGISMSSIMVGSICSTLTLTIVQEISTGVPQGVKIGALMDTPDFEVAKDVSSKAGAILLSFPNVEELVYALKEQEIDSIVLDHYTVKWKKNLFNGTWFKYSDTVGSSFSYGVLLNGNAEKLERHFREYISANISQIMQLAGILDTIYIADKNQTQEEEETAERIVITKESLNFLSPDSTIFTDTMLAMGLALLAIFLAGIYYHVTIYRKREQANEILREKYREYLEMIQSELHEFHSKFCLMNANLRKKLIESLQTVERKASSPEPEKTEVMPIQYHRRLSECTSESEL